MRNMDCALHRMRQNCAVGTEQCFGRSRTTQVDGRVECTVVPGCEKVCENLSSAGRCVSAGITGEPIDLGLPSTGDTYSKGWGLTIPRFNLAGQSTTSGKVACDTSPDRTTSAYDILEDTIHRVLVKDA